MPKFIDELQCISCGVCEETCLVGCISEKDDSIRTINAQACVDCGACTLVCPVQCIENL